LAEIAQHLCDCGQCSGLDEATCFVLRQFGNRLLAGGRARYVFDGEDCDFDATELGAVYGQQSEDGCAIELTKDNPALLQSDLGEHLFLPLASVQPRARGWKWSLGGAEEHASSPEATSEPPSRPSGSDCRPALTEERADRWFADRETNWPDTDPAPSEADDWVAFCGHFGRDAASRETFRELRRKYTFADWHKQGPRLPWGKLRQKSAIRQCAIRRQF
jgi:hypothetical protein